MHKFVLTAAGALSLFASAAPAQPAPSVVQLDQIKWPTPGGMSMVTLSGDPMAADQPFTVVMKLADGRWIPPHWHPRAKTVVVLQGTMLLGHGDRLDSLSAQAIRTGGIAQIPADTRHFEGARGETVLLMYGIGPFTTTMVNAPRRSIDQTAVSRHVRQE